MEYNFLEGYSLLHEDLDAACETLGAFTDLHDASFFLTGGTGFFGIWLTECLIFASRKLKFSLKITSLARDPEAFYVRHPHLRQYEELRLVQGDLVKFPIINDPITHIIHAGSVSKATAEERWAFAHLEAALYGTRNVLQLAQTHDAKALIVSSGGAYKFPLSRAGHCRLAEEFCELNEVVSEANIYALGKRCMEAQAATWTEQYGLSVCAARCFAFIGPWLPLDANYAAGNFIRDALRGGPISISGDGTPLRSYLYPTDLVGWLLTLLLRGTAGLPYNVGGESSVSIGELACVVAREAGLPQKSVHIMTPATEGTQPNDYVPNIDRAKALGLAVTVSLEEAVKRTLFWHNHRQQKD